MSREENKERDKERPIIVHSIGLLIQHATACDDDDAIEAAWNVFDFLGQPTTVGLIPPERAREILRKHKM